jgi:hypothetical protein
MENNAQFFIIHDNRVESVFKSLKIYYHFFALVCVKLLLVCMGPGVNAISSNLYHTRMSSDLATVSAMVVLPGRYVRDD